MKGIIILFVISLLGMACEKTSDCVAISKEDCACTYEYDPVCGCDRVTYGNACAAECNGITDYSKGACE